MFLRYFEFIFKPFRKARGKAMQVKNVKGRIKVDAKRVKGYGGMAKKKAGMAQKHAQGAQKQAQGAQQQAQGAQQQMGGAMPQGGGGGQQQQGAMMQGQMPQGGGGAPNPNPPIKVVGFFRKKKICTQCNTELDKTWDSCPYCAQAAAAQQPAAPAQKTMAFMVDPGGGGSSMQLLGWLVPVQGPQRGELFTLAPKSTIGTEPTCTICLNDSYMSSQHAEINAEGGVWVLKDLGSTNGTFVNDKRVDQHELVDNDFVKFGQSLVKFKSL